MCYQIVRKHQTKTVNTIPFPKTEFQKYFGLVTNEQEVLWKSIKRFELDDVEASMTFTDRLCRENSWPIDYGVRAVLEYKKFMMLICVSGHPCTPSDEVDQVWHLHLLYTVSYWKEFCQNVLRREVHHGPTKGGGREREKYKDWYAETLKSYEELFEMKPPEDLWPSPENRMKFINFSRINRHQNWVIKKPKRLWN